MSNNDLELEIRSGAPSAKLTRDEFRARFRAQFFDPAFEAHEREIAALEEVAWSANQEGRKAPRTRAAGPEFADPSYELSIEWLAARAAIRTAQTLHDDPTTQTRILVIAGAARNEHTCPGEISKTMRLAFEASDELRAQDCHVDLLDLSRVTAEYGVSIHPCKGCVSTAMPLCHWPCSCYPNHALGQSQDWMNEIYPMWVAAHGIAIVTPVYWWQAPTPLKAMIDRLVCADGGNPDPTTTHGKNAAAAKALELAGWSYPRHLAGRVFSVFVHGDTEGANGLRQNLHDWLVEMHLEPANADLARYIGYYEPYATSHDELDADEAVVTDCRRSMRVLADRAKRKRVEPPRVELDEARPK